MIHIILVSTIRNDSSLVPLFSSIEAILDQLNHFTQVKRLFDLLLWYSSRNLRKVDIVKINFLRTIFLFNHHSFKEHFLVFIHLLNWLRFVFKEVLLFSWLLNLFPSYLFIFPCDSFKKRATPM